MSNLQEKKIRWQQTTCRIIERRTRVKKHFKEIQVKIKVRAKDFSFFFLILFFGCTGSSLLLEDCSCGEQGPLLAAVCGLVTVLLLQNVGSRACRLQSLRQVSSAVVCTGFAPWGMWNLPRPGIEPVSPPLAGGFLITGPPGKSRFQF